ncbi:MAG TPA: sodium:solute symporter family protein [Gammaproteobacteria bacterium]
MNGTALAVALVAFVLLMLGIGMRARSRVRSAEDYLVAGRRLSLPLASATLFATWFGAGTMLTASDQIRAEGLGAAALEPIGPGLCLVLAGAFFAGRLWRMKLLTLSDFYRRRFGPRAEVLASVIMVPGYFGWIAAQFVALAGILELFWGIPLRHGLWLVAAVGTWYTLLGGMWSVTLTDAAQAALIVVGLAVLAATMLAKLAAAGGLDALVGSVPAEHLKLVPAGDPAALVGWLSVLAVGALGNIPGQDLAQRIFSARSDRVASLACVVSGVLYVALGLVPAFVGLAADALGVQTSRSTVPALAAALMTPALGIVFVLAIIAAVMSTIESAILAPSSVLAHNLLAKLEPRASTIALTKVAILGVAACSLGVAYSGSSAYELLESAYAVGMVGLFVPLVCGLHGRRGDERAALAAMAAGIGIWMAHLALGWDTFAGPWLDVPVPQELAATGIAWAAYEGLAVGAAYRRRWVIAPRLRGS